MKIRLKILLITLLTSVIIFSIAMGYTAWIFRQTTIDFAGKVINSYARDASRGVQAELDYHMGIAHALRNTALTCLSMPNQQRAKYFNSVMEQTLRQNPEYLAVWMSWELSAIDSAWHKPYGRQRSMVYMLNGEYSHITDTLDTQGDVIEGLYYKLKVGKKDAITNPYVYKYQNTNDSILEASIAIPVLKGNEYIGLAGNDIPMTTFISLIEKIKPFKESSAFFISNDGTFVVHPNHEKIGTKISHEFKDFNFKNRILERIKQGYDFSFVDTDPRTGQESFFSFVPVHIKSVDTPWAIAIAVPNRVILQEAIRNLQIAIVVSAVGVVILFIVIGAFITQITTPLKSMTHIFDSLAKGKVDKSQKLKIKTTDEIGQMSKSANQLIDKLNDMAVFAREIGRGNLKAGYKPSGEEDRLGHALLDMRENLIDAELADQQMREAEKKRSWKQEGITQLGNVLRLNYDTIEELAYAIIKFLIKYTNANQGALYVLDDTNPQNIIIRMEAAYAFERKKQLQNNFAPGEGLVGRCVKEQEAMYMTNLPEGYTFITSGLGQEEPRVLVIIPMVFNEEAFGAFEMASFNELQPYQIEFLKDAAERIASTVSNTRKSVRTAALLQQSQKVSKELAEKEEQMRKNLMELQLAQENAKKKETETETIIEAISSVASIVYYDTNGIITDIKDPKIKLFNLSRKDFVGRKQSEINPEFRENPEAYQLFWQALLDGKIQKRLFVYQNKKQKIWIDETYTPIYNKDKQIYQILNIGIDVTELMQLKEQLNNNEKN